MDDLISRQAALQAVGSESWAGARIENLPSAQPEIRRCENCKHWSEYEYVNGKRVSFPFCKLHMTFFEKDEFCSRHADREEKADE